MGQFLEEINFYVGLELLAAVLGVLSVWYAKKNKILVYPTGLISTLIYVLILFKNKLLGDLIINVYFFLMSINMIILKLLSLLKEKMVIRI